MIKKEYVNLKTKEATTSATVAMAWHRQGIDVDVWKNAPIYPTRIQGATIKKNDDYMNNRAHCKSIAMALEDYANGLVYKCPNCGEIITVNEDWTGDDYICPDCGNHHRDNEMEELTLWDYFEDVYDVEYRVGSDLKLRSVCVMVACGGPNIYIDTGSRQVELYWWGDRASYSIDYDVCIQVDDYFQEILDCM